MEAETLEGPYQVIVVPLLTGSELTAAMDRILVVDCDEHLQIARLLARDAESENQARRILAAQAGRQERLAIADDIIMNNGTLAELETAVAELHDKYVRLAASAN